MKLGIVLSIGAVIGFLFGSAIFFEKREKYRPEIFAASSLRCVLVALLTFFSVSAPSAWWQGAAFGVLYGLVTALVVYLAKGGWRSGDAPYVLISSVVTGGIIGGLVVRFAL